VVEWGEETVGVKGEVAVGAVRPQERLEKESARE
jgi:hypothetical protein